MEQYKKRPSEKLPDGNQRKSVVKSFKVQQIFSVFHVFILLASPRVC